MSWSAYNINWSAPEYWRADCMEALRRAVNERFVHFGVELSFTNIDDSIAVDRETGEVSWTDSNFRTNAVVLTSPNSGSITECFKNINLQKLNFPRYVQIGHWIDKAIWQLVHTIPWIMWWKASSFEGVTKRMTSSLKYTISGTKNVYNHEELRDYCVISDIADILDYIGDEKLYLFSEYGDNTNWARQKYDILNTLKVIIPICNKNYGLPSTGYPNVTGHYEIKRRGTHAYTWQKYEDSDHPEENWESETGDGPFSSSLDSALAHGDANAYNPPISHTGDGATLGQLSSYSFTTRCYEYFYQHDSITNQYKNSLGNVEYMEYCSGALTNKQLIPCTLTTYVCIDSLSYTGYIYKENGFGARDIYDHTIPDPNPNGIQQYAPFENWNPWGVENTHGVWHVFNSYELTPEIDFKEAIEKMMELDKNIPSMPTLPNCTSPHSDFSTWRYGDFGGTWIYDISNVLEFQFEFHS